MDELEKAEKIREKTGVSYEEAKNALKASDGDILDAIIYLENLGKVQAPSMSNYTTGNEMIRNSERFESAQAAYNADCRKSSFGETMNSLFGWVGRFFKKCVDTSFVVSREGKVMGKIPVLALILLVIFTFWVTIPLMIIGLFFDFKYEFAGIDKITVDLNEMCDKASDVCTNIKNDIKSEKYE